MYYELRITKGRKVVFSMYVVTMEEALDWFLKYEAEQPISDCVFQIIPKIGVL